MADPLDVRPARFRALWRLARPALGLLAAAFMVGCQEKLTVPGECPDLCPGGQLSVVDTVLDAIPGQDSSFVGYLGAGQGDALLISNGLPGSDDRAIVRFIRRQDSVAFTQGQTTVNKSYVIDSVEFTFTVRGRDSTVNPLQAILYRLPTTIDSTATFASIDPALIGANLIDTVLVPKDSTTVRLMLRGSKLARVEIPPADSGVLAVGMRITAAAPTGLRIGSLASGTGMTFRTFVTLNDVENEELRDYEFLRVPAFNSFVSQGTLPLADTLLTVGGEPSARALVRFNFPAYLRDSVSIVRATLELVPAVPLNGLANDPTLLEARSVLGDLGAKSPLCVIGGVCGGTLLTSATLKELVNASTDTVQFEVPQIVRAWQGLKPAPAAIFLIIRPEAATFMRPAFFSTRASGGAPKLRISYVPLSPFSSP